MARRKGFEPLTPRFEVWCSIQLSYRRLERIKGRTLSMRLTAYSLKISSLSRKAEGSEV